MLKSFCDICGAEVDRNYATSGYAATWTAANGLVVRINTSSNVEGKASRGDLCETCFRKALAEGKEISMTPGG